jgi:biotin carboxyl carrier protein
MWLVSCYFCRRSETTTIMKHDDPYKISVNGQHSFDLMPADAQALDFVVEADGQFHILHNGTAYRATLVAAHYDARSFTFNINGDTFTVQIADRYDQLVQQLGLSVGSSQKANVIKAPMPGLVLSIMATPGQAVAKGDPLLILEAMKMENVIKASGDGVVKSIHVQQGAAVEKGQLLLEMDA